MLLTKSWKKHTSGLSNYFFMFLSAGLFVNMLSETGWLLMLESFFREYINAPSVFYLLTAAFFLLMSLIGFHPLIAISLFSEIIYSMLNEIAIVPFTIVLITCSLSTVMYSPFNLSVSLLSDELKINPYKISSWNIGFAVFNIMVSIYAALLIHSMFY
ncbi:hypothetical protein [Cohnella kolymensis]|uniref:hypothetical protein n=1 Tax=Cohnella kolymensis TaxID=1590652 RepID=UPI00126A72FA|nr:hypothetical protein [Cohnella kolymensis]